MFRWFLPKEICFFDFFDKHASIIVQAAEEFLSLILNGKDQAFKADRIKELEHDADSVTHQCIEALHKTFITPFDRDDIYRLISCMDNIIDYIEEAAARMMLYKLQEGRSESKELVAILVDATKEIERAVKGLRTVKNIKELRTVFIRVNQLENEADLVLRQAIGRLFDEEQDTRLLIKWKEICENIENAVDSCKDVANIIEGVTLEYS